MFVFFLILIANINPRNPYTIAVKHVFVVGLLFFLVSGYFYSVFCITFYICERLFKNS